MAPPAEEKIVVYHYRANGKPVVPNSLAVITNRALQVLLKENPNLRSTTISLPHRAAMGVDIHQSDLMENEFPALPPVTPAPAVTVDADSEAAKETETEKVAEPSSPASTITWDAETNGDEKKEKVVSNAASNVAGIKLPLGVWAQGLVKGGWKEVTVVFEGFGAVS